MAVTLPDIIAEEPLSEVGNVSRGGGVTLGFLPLPMVDEDSKWSDFYRSKILCTSAKSFADHGPDSPFLSSTHSRYQGATANLCW